MKKSLAVLGLASAVFTGSASAQILTANVTFDGVTKYYEFDRYADVENFGMTALLADFGYTDIDQVSKIRINGKFAGQTFNYADLNNGNLTLNMEIEDADALFAGIRDADPQASLDDDDLRLYEAILEGNSLAVTIDEAGNAARMVIGDDAIVVTFDDDTGNGTIQVKGQAAKSFTGTGDAGDAMIEALGDELDIIQDDNAQLSQLLSNFTGNSIAKTYDDPIAGNPTSVVGRMPGILTDMRGRQIPDGKNFAFFGKLEYENVNYDNSGDADVISADLAGHVRVGPGELSVTVPLAYVEYSGGEEVGHVGVILGYGLTMNDFIDNMPWEWRMQGNLGAVGGTSDALVDTALVSTVGINNSFMTSLMPTSDKIELGWELGINYFSNPDIDIDDFSQTYDFGITGITFGALGNYKFDNGMAIEGAIRRTEFSGEELAIDAQNELDLLISSVSGMFGGGLTYGFGDNYEAISAQGRVRF